jgi:hypothetical protein
MVTVSVWPMISNGRFLPLPLSRATTFGRSDSMNRICAGMPESSSVFLMYSASGRSFAVESNRTTAWKCFSVSGSTAFQSGSAGRVCADSVVATARTDSR